MNTKEEIQTYLRTEYKEDELTHRVDEASMNYLDDDWEEEFDSEEEAYLETGRGEAESEVRTEIEAAILEKMGLPTDALAGGYEKFEEMIGQPIWEVITEVYEFLDS